MSSLINNGRVGAVVAITFVACFLVSAGLVPIVRAIARRVNAVDRPGLGKVHSGATPYFGGVAIGVAAVGVPTIFSGWKTDAAYILVGATLVALTGLVDDLRDLSPLPRLGIELLAAVLATAGGARIGLFPGWVGIAATLVFIVIVTNSFNLLDNMDGCASIVGTATGLALLTAAIIEKQVLVGALAAGIVGSCLGFLLYNWHPASIFMGDAGSLFLGFLLAVTTLKLKSPDATRLQSMVGTALILAVPLFDTTLVVVSRRRHGRSIMLGGKDHLSHRLNLAGLGIRKVALSLGAISLLASSLGVAVLLGNVNYWLAIGGTVTLATVSIIPLLRMEVYVAGATRGPRSGDGNEPPSPGGSAPAVIDLASAESAVAVAPESGPVNSVRRDLGVQRSHPRNRRLESFTKRRGLHSREK